MSESEYLVQRYLSGEMTPDEEVVFERQVRSTPELASELAQQSEGLTALYTGLAQNAPAPRNRIKKEILEKIGDRHSNEAELENLHLIVRQSESEWTPTTVEGISCRILYIDEDDRVMALVRLEPGAVFPSHPHSGTEECYIVSGDFKINGQALSAGDFIAAREGAEHYEISTENGCELLLKQPMTYEFFNQAKN